MNSQKIEGNLTLNAVERESALWKKIERTLNARIEELRTENESALNLDDTNRIRGAIKNCREILEWGDPAPEINN